MRMIRENPYVVLEKANLIKLRRLYEGKRLIGLLSVYIAFVQTLDTCDELTEDEVIGIISCDLGICIDDVIICVNILEKHNII